MTKDMTQGPILKSLIGFTIPLVFGTLLQLTYNAADSIIVGRFVGKTALAAVGTTNPLVTLILLFTNGICLGAGILVGMLYGARKIEKLQKQISTGMIAGVVFTLITTALMFLAARPILHLIQVEEQIMGEAVRYLRIILLGMIFSFIYNYLASMLRAMGDSISPLIFLAISAIINICGDLLFVVSLRMGVEGAAISTVLCEGVSALLCLLYIHVKIPELRLGRKWLVFEMSLLKTTLSYGFVSAVQQSAVQLGILGTQTIVNTLGVNATAAFNATNRFDDFAMVPERNISHAMTSVMAQNEGAGKEDRVMRTFKMGMLIEVIFGLCLGLVTLTAARPLIGLFTTDPEVIEEGTRYLKLMSLFYWLPALTNGLQGFFRGKGDLKITLYSTLINMGSRVVSEVIMILGFGMGFIAIPWSYLIGWIAMMLFEAPFLKRCLHNKNTLPFVS